MPKNISKSFKIQKILTKLTKLTKPDQPKLSSSICLEVMMEQTTHSERVFLSPWLPWHFLMQILSCIFPFLFLALPPDCHSFLQSSSPWLFLPTNMSASYLYPAPRKISEQDEGNDAGMGIKGSIRNETLICILYSSVNPSPNICIYTLIFRWLCFGRHLEAGTCYLDTADHLQMLVTTLILSWSRLIISKRPHFFNRLCVE